MVRLARPGDAEGVARVHVRSWQVAYAHVFPAERLADISLEARVDLARAVIASETPTLVVEDASGIVGFVSVGPTRDDDAAGAVGEVYAIYVDPDHWRRGVGRSLLAAGEKRLRELGFEQATLWVLDENPPARRFYEAGGWQLDGATRTGQHLGLRTVEVRYLKCL